MTWPGVPGCGGTSEWRGGQIAHAVGLARQWGLYPPAMEQPQYHMLHRHIVETELVEAARQHGIGLVTWSPLASGILTGKYNPVTLNPPPACAARR